MKLEWSFLVLIFLPALVFACNPLYTEYSDETRKETAIFAWGRNQYGGLGNGQFDSFGLPQKLHANYPYGKVVSYFHTVYFTLIINEQSKMFISGIHYFNSQHTVQINNELVPLNYAPMITAVSSHNSRVDVVFANQEAATMLGTSFTKFTASNFTNGGVIASSTGSSFSIFLAASRKGLYAYGSNISGALTALLKTNETMISTLRYADLSYLLQSDETILSIKSGAMHSIFYTSKNRIFAFGNNEKYQLGLGNTSFASTEIIPIILPNNLQLTATVGSVGASSYGSFIHFRSNNQIFSFGTGDKGELGSPFSEFGPFTRPTSITQGTILSTFEISQLVVFTTTVSVITKDGLLISWGYNTFGQVLSTSTNARIYTPERSNLEFIVSQVSSNEYYYLALSTDNEFYAWGTGIPNADNTLSSNFVDLRNVVDKKNPIGFLESYIATYGFITSDYSLYIWGYNPGYQLGQRGNGIIPLPSLFAPRNQNISQVSCAATGFEHLIYISKKDSQMYGLGSNNAFQLGDGTSYARLQPVLINTTQPIRSSTYLMASSTYNCEVTESIYCWGGFQWAKPTELQSLATVLPLKKVFVYKDGLLAWSAINDTLWFVDKTSIIASPIASHLQVKNIHCSIFNCVLQSKENSIFILGQAYLSLIDNVVSFIPVHLQHFEPFKEDIIGIKTTEFTSFVYTKNKVYGWGINYSKLLRNDEVELFYYDRVVEVDYVPRALNQLFQNYHIIDMSVSTYSVHLLLGRNRIINLEFLFFLIPITVSLLVVMLAIIAVVVAIVVVIVVKTARKKKDIYKQLLDLESKSETEMPLLLPSKFDCFKINFEQIELLQEIGTGGSGALVFKAKWYNEIVAIKLFRASVGMSNSFDFTLFEQEVELLTQLRHSNIVLFYGATLAKNRVGLVLQYCSNGNLTQFMKKKHLNLKRKIQLLIQLGKALSFLHSKNIIHRDVKMDNILIDENEFVKLSDFGLSKSISENSNMTKGVGTDHMIAPEVTLGQEYDISADVFSFGIIMMELLIEKVNPYIEGEKQVSGIGVKVALDPTCRPRVPLDFPLQTYHKGYLLLMQECWKHEKNERPLIQQVVERLEQIEKELPDTAA